MKVLVIGASSFLGKKLVKTLREKGYTVLGTHFSSSADILAVDAGVRVDLNQFSLSNFNDIAPDVVVHVAAMTNVDVCEQKQEEALRVNTASVAQIANWCRAQECKFIYISSDYVFDGFSGPYFEESMPSPINFYGLTKFLAEELTRKLIKDYVIIRPTILYGYNDDEDKPTFPTQIIEKLRAGERITADNSRTKYPTMIDDVADGILKLIELDSRGVFHFCNREPLTRYEWAQIVADVFELPADLISGAPLDENISPPRPIDVELIQCCSKIVFKPVTAGLSLMKKQMDEKI